MKETIRLFKAVPIIVKKKKTAIKELIETTMKKGFIFAPEVIHNYSKEEINELITVVEKEVGLTAEEMNASFHKSWKKVRDASREQLVWEQIIHYMTTYGFEAMGIYNESSVYILNEKLDIPEVNLKEIKFVVIRGYTKKELKEKLVSLLNTGIALKDETLDDVTEVAKFVELTEDEVEGIKNKEAKIRMYIQLNIVPANPIEFLRYILYLYTEKSLLIKNKGTIAIIKENSTLKINSLLVGYGKKHSFNRLAKIFYRFKPVFLALRKDNQTKHIINKIRKLAKKYHKPMKEDYLNNITCMIKEGKKIKEKELNEELNKVNTFRKIRLAYALKYRTKDVDSILYRIRNGKGYAIDFNFSDKKEAKRVMDLVVESIITDVKKNVKGKKIYIPENIKYALPSTEKQFTGDLPSGTYIEILKDMVAGIYWENVKEHRIDLDLSLMSPTTGKIGWDGDYRSNDGSILFSGDITDAPKGASELFYIRKQKMESYIMFVNYFNFEEKVEVPFKIVVGKQQANEFNNYMIDPNNVICVAKSNINRKQKILGLIVTTTDNCRFYFVETYLGNSITAGNAKFVENSRKYLFNFYKNTISFNEILKKAGAKLVDKREKCDIDLSPEVLQKDTILNLIK